jgi:hypothetical protein
MTQIRILKGEYRNNDMSGKVFTMVRPYQVGAKGGFVTVEGADYNGLDKIRIRLESFRDYEVLGEGAPQTDSVAVPVASAESDEEVMSRIEQRFDILVEMSKAAIGGDIRALIVSGPPGVGKSHGVETEIEKAQLFDKVAGRRIKSEVVKGSATAIGLYQMLYKYSDKNCVLVFDDCDSILFDDVCLNLLKGALDSGKKRKISWMAESRVLKEEGIPNSFTFNGSVIFITNLKFDHTKSGKLRDHLEALQSRCHYLDLTMDSTRDKWLWVKSKAVRGELFAGYDFSDETRDEIIDFMWGNASRLREMSLRMAVKIADLARMSPNWRNLARSTCMRAL